MKFTINVHGDGTATVDCPEHGMADCRWTMHGTLEIGPRFRLAHRHVPESRCGLILLCDDGSRLLLALHAGDRKTHDMEITEVEGDLCVAIKIPNRVPAAPLAHA